MCNSVWEGGGGLPCPFLKIDKSAETLGEKKALSESLS